jgi:hypothetical protein
VSRNIFKAKSQTLIVAGTVIAAMLICVGCGSKSKLLNYPENTGYKVSPAPADKAQVIFLRPNKLGYKIAATVYDDDTFISTVTHNTIVTYLTGPGSHRFMVIGEAADFLGADLEPGKTYFVQVVPRMGVWKARFSLGSYDNSPETLAKIREWIAAGYPVESNDLGAQWSLDNRQSVLDKKEKYLPKWEEREDTPKILPENGIDTL